MNETGCGESLPDLIFRNPAHPLKEINANQQWSKILIKDSLHTTRLIKSILRTFPTGKNIIRENVERGRK
jgi:hypothetical protein